MTYFVACQTSKHSVIWTVREECRPCVLVVIWHPFVFCWSWLPTCMSLLKYNVRLRELCSCQVLFSSLWKCTHNVFGWYIYPVRLCQLINYVFHFVDLMFLTLVPYNISPIQLSFFVYVSLLHGLLQKRLLSHVSFDQVFLSNIMFLIFCLLDVFIRNYVSCCVYQPQGFSVLNWLTVLWYVKLCSLIIHQFCPNFPV